MTTATVDASAREGWTRATDAVEDGVRAARRAFKTAQRSLQNAADLRDEAAYRVKREPLKAVGFAFGAGLLMGVVGSFVGRRCATPADKRNVC
jgi:ElaB/YqjD/DUF883 family membrane-anchored ribosome-binding protein